MKIIADDKIPFLKGVLEPFAEIKYIPGKQIDASLVKDADALLVRTRTKCSKEILEGSDVKFIGTATIGFDHIDTGYCDSNNIFWTNAPGCNSSSVQQYIASVLVNIASEYGFNIHDKTIGIIGVGNVGSKVEKLANNFGMKILLNDPPRARNEGSDRFVPLDYLLKESDIVTVHVPLYNSGEDKTYHLFDEATFKMMKRRAFFINSSRGEVTDTVALKHALSSEYIAGAAVDVWENEPDIDKELLKMLFIATPHIAGYSVDGKANGTSKVVNELLKFFKLHAKKWYPENIPLPVVTDMEIDCSGKTDEKVVKEAICFSYDILRDDSKLRGNPSDFERQRGDYPVRREFPSFSIKLLNSTGKAFDILSGLGFKIVS